MVSKEEFSKLLWAKDFVTIQRGQQLGNHECVWATHHSTNRMYQLDQVTLKKKMYYILNILQYFHNKSYVVSYY